MTEYRNPTPAVDAVVFYRNYDHIILIDRKNPPHGLALPGGFVNENETLEEAIKREVKEELGLNIFLQEQFYTYSHPERDIRKHVMSTVFIATTTDIPKAGDDADAYVIVNAYTRNMNLAFDHAQIINDVNRYIATGQRRKLD